MAATDLYAQKERLKHMDVPACDQAATSLRCSPAINLFRQSLVPPQCHLWVTSVLVCHACSRGNTNVVDQILDMGRRGAGHAADGERHKEIQHHADRSNAFR